MHAARLILLSALLAVSTPHAEPLADPFQEKLQQASRELLGRPYAFSPLGEGQTPDSDPTLRLDAFDCATYVETVMAMALADEHSDLQTWLNRIRYQNAQVGFSQRRHLPDFQWLPQLQQLGLLHDVTRQIGEGTVGQVEARISPTIWQQRRWRILEDLPPQAVPSRRIALPYLPLSQAAAKLARVQQTVLLSVVHAEHPQAPLLISHQALLIPHPSGPRVRHARSGGDARVVEEPLTRFVARLRGERFWPVLGLNVAEIRQAAVK